MAYTSFILDKQGLYIHYRLVISSLNVKDLHCHHHCYCWLTKYSSHIMCMYFYYIHTKFHISSPMVYWLLDRQFQKEFRTAAMLLFYILWVWLPLQNFHTFWGSIIIHPPLQLSRSHAACCSSLLCWHTCHVTITGCKKSECMIFWGSIH